MIALALPVWAVVLLAVVLVLGALQIAVVMVKLPGSVRQELRARAWRRGGAADRLEELRRQADERARQHAASAGVNW